MRDSICLGCNRRVSRILVIDDEPRLVSVLRRALANDGHLTEGATDGEVGMQLALARDYGLILLDLLMPETSGTTVLERTMAERPDQPVLVLSALSDVETKVRCFELGAVDYLAKPFALAELLARVRMRTGDAATINGNGSHLDVGRIHLDLQRRLADAGEGPVEMSNREFLLLKYLMSRQGEVCSREEILAEVWGFSFDPGTNVVDVYVGRLRSKIGQYSIETVRNVGYALAA